MLVEIDEILVNKKDWKKTKDGDDVARQRVIKSIDGLVLYMHNLAVSGNQAKEFDVITLRDLESAHIFCEITIRLVPPG